MTRILAATASAAVAATALLAPSVAIAAPPHTAAAAVRAPIYNTLVTRATPTAYCEVYLNNLRPVLPQKVSGVWCRWRDSRGNWLGSSKLPKVARVYKYGPWITAVVVKAPNGQVLVADQRRHYSA